MQSRYFTVLGAGTSEVIEKKSRFLGLLLHAETTEEAESAVAAVRKKHYDARHNCFAYIVGEPGGSETLRAGDDGEPQGTAGRPMLEVLKGRELHNCVLVVTRYFGGTLLGTGGLIRAYTEAAQKACESAEIVEKLRGTRIRLHVSYNASGKLGYLFAGEGVTVLDTAYGADVQMDILAPEGEETVLQKRITEATDGKVEIERLDQTEIDLR